MHSSRLESLISKTAYFEQQKAALVLEMAELNALFIKVETSIFEFQLKAPKQDNKNLSF
jgi:hypothetical protein